jgi:hypothetical protein
MHRLSVFVFVDAPATASLLVLSLCYTTQGNHSNSNSCTPSADGACTFPAWCSAVHIRDEPPNPDCTSVCHNCVFAALPGGRGRGPPPQQRRRDSLPDDVTLVTELKRHEKVHWHHRHQRQQQAAVIAFGSGCGGVSKYCSLTASIAVGTWYHRPGCWQLRYRSLQLQPHRSICRRPTNFCVQPCTSTAAAAAAAHVSCPAVAVLCLTPVCVYLMSAASNLPLL